MGCCVCKYNQCKYNQCKYNQSHNNYNNYNNYNKDTIINPIYTEDEEEPLKQKQKPKLIRRTKEDNCADAAEFLKELDDYLLRTSMNTLQV
jgi:hypothetical protein